jgi:hypothetical protein
LPLIAFGGLFFEARGRGRNFGGEPSSFRELAFFVALLGSGIVSS